MLWEPTGIEAKNISISQKNGYNGIGKTHWVKRDRRGVHRGALWRLLMMIMKDFERLEVVESAGSSDMHHYDLYPTSIMAQGGCGINDVMWSLSLLIVLHYFEWAIQWHWCIPSMMPDAKKLNLHFSWELTSAPLWMSKSTILICPTTATVCVNHSCNCLEMQTGMLSNMVSLHMLLLITVGLIMVYNKLKEGLGLKLFCGQSDCHFLVTSALTTC